nr:EEIG1/EHBP1 N-terminal domain-containing protein [Tanacetum cinerariifolium]
DDEIQALVQKQIDEDMVCHKAIMNLALQFDNACTTKEELRLAYQKCGSSSQTHEICDLYLTEKELHQLHLEEEALRETLEEAAVDEKARKNKIRQKQANDEEFFLEFGVVRYDSDYHTRVEPSSLIPNPVRIILGPAGIVQLSSSTRVEPSPSTPNPVMIMPGHAGTIPETISHKVIDGGGYEKDITIGAAMILANVSVFTPKSSKHYLNITMRNVVDVFR